MAWTDRELIRIDRLLHRADFLKARKGRRIHAPAFLIQVIPNRSAGTGEFARVGFTVTKKLGNAVTRNRIKRRLRAAVRETFPTTARPGFDYVIIARAAAQTRPYERLLDDLRTALVDPANFPNGL